MSAKVCIGSFTKDAGTVAQVVTGVVDHDGAAFTPVGAIFWVGGNIGGGFTNANACWSYGFDDGTHARSVGTIARDNGTTPTAGTSNAAVLFRTASSIVIPDFVSIVIGQLLAGHVTAWSSGGFTFTWTASSTTLTGVRVSYCVFGGTGVSCQVGSKDVTAGGSQTFSGLGFTPTWVGFTAAPSIANANHGEFGFHVNAGWMNSYGCQSAWSVWGSEPVPSNTTRLLRTDRCMSLLFSTSTADNGACVFTSMSSGQFVVNWTSGPATDFAQAYIALGGITGVIGSFARGLTVAPEQVTGLGVTSRATLMMTNGNAVTSSVTDEGRIAMGGRSTGSDPDCQWVGLLDAQDPTVTATYGAETACIAATPVAAGASSVLLSEISTIANIADGFQTFYSDADATARQFVYTDFGDYVSTPMACPDDAVVIPPEPPPDPGETRLIRRVRIFPLPFDRNLRISVPRIEVLPQAGVGTTGQGADPQLIMRVSKDGGRTYGTQISLSVGKVGEYFERWYVNRLGQGRNWVIELSMTDPVAWYLLACYVDMSGGSN